MSEQDNLGNPNQTNEGFGRRTEFTPQQVAPEAERYVAQSPQDLLEPKEVPLLKKRSKQSRNSFVVF